MTPCTLHVRGINSLLDTSVDFTQIGDGLCAVVGDNGTGKTTLLECAGVAATHRTMPTRPGKKPGNVLDCATARDTLIDLVQHHAGHEWRHVIQIDAGLKHPRVEAYLYRDGEPLNDGKTGTYDEAIAEHFPPLSMMLASTFAAQGGAGSFAQLSAADRRSLFRQMLGLDYLQRLAERAAVHRKAADALLGDLQRDEVRLRATETSAAEIDEQISVEALKTDGLRDSAAESDTANTAAQVALHAAQLQLSKATDVRREVIDKRAALDLRARDARERVETTSQDLKRAEGVTAQAEQIRTDHATAQHIEQELTQAREDYRTAEDAWKRAKANEEARTRSKDQAQRSAEDVQRRIAAAEEAQVGVESLEAKAEALAKARAEQPTLLADHRSTTRDAVDLLETHRKAERREDIARRAVETAEAAAAQLDTVPCGGRRVIMQNLTREECDAGLEDVRADCSTCSFLTAATEARDSLTERRGLLVSRVMETQRAAEAHQRADAVKIAASDALAAVDAEIASMADADARLEAATAALAELPALRERATEIQATINDCDDAIAKALGEQTEHVADRDEAGAAGTKARAALDALDGHAQRLGSLESAETRIPLLRQAVADHTAARDAAQVELDAIEIPPEPEEQRAKTHGLIDAAATAATAATTARTVLDDHTRALARLRGQRDALGDFSGHLREVTTAREAIGKRRAGFAMVEHAMGPTGIQALEIDAAGPGVSDIANDLLRAVGVGYTAQIRTQTGGVGRKKLRESFDIVVGLPDGGERELARMSFGEQTLVEEAIKLAIATHVSQSTGAQLGTLWRDECDGDLSDGNASRYPAMLRAAMDLGGFDRCFFITHRPDVAAQADHILHVGAGGKVTILDPEEYTSNAAIAAK